MITQIGLTAGDVWNHLDSCEGTDNLDNIVRNLGTDRDLLLMGIGWLAREGHITLENIDSNYEVKLVSKESTQM